MTIIGSLKQAPLPSHDGFKIIQGRAKFDGTEASGTLPVQAHQIDSVQLTPCTQPAADETVFCTELNSATRAPVVVPANGRITIGRTGAAKTADLVFSVAIYCR
jgi:hypothetical protein